MSFQRRRVQGFDQNPTQLRPMAGPRGLISGRVAADTGGASKADQLASALQSFHAPLQNLTAMAVERHNLREDAAAQRHAAGSSPQELWDQIREGEVEGSRRFRRTLSQLAGRKYAADLLRQAHSEYQQSPHDVGPDIEPWLEERFAEELDSFSADDHFMAGVSEVLPRGMEAMRENHAQHMLEETVRETQEYVFSAMLDSVEMDRGEGLSAADTLSNIRERYDELRELGLHPRDLDRTLVQVAQQRALQGDVEFVEEVFDNDRGGVGPLGKTQKYFETREELVNQARAHRFHQSREQYFDTTQAIRDRIRNTSPQDSRAEFNAWIRQLHNDHPEFMSAEDVERYETQFADSKHRAVVQSQQVSASAYNDMAMALAMEDLVDPARETGTAKVAADNAGLEWVDVEGQTHRLSADEIAGYLDGRLQDDLLAFENELRASDEYSEDEIAEAVFINKAQLHSRSGTTDEGWELTLRGGHAAIQVGDFTQGKIPKVTLEAAELARRLYENSPALYRAHTDPEARQFFEAYRIQRQFFGASEEVAVATAFNRTMGDKALNPDQRERLRREVDAVTSIGRGRRGWLSRLSMGLIPKMHQQITGKNVQYDIENVSHVHVQLRSLAEDKVLAGAPFDKAIEEAEVEIMENSVNYRGSFLWGVRDEEVEWLDHYMEDTALPAAEELGYDPRRISVMPIGNGQAWGVWDHESRSFVEDLPVVDRQSLAEGYVAKAEAERQERLQRYVERENERRGSVASERYGPGAVR